MFLNGGVDDQVANSICAQLLFLEAEDPNSDITFQINSPGGVITAGMAIIDTMNFIKPDINTIVIGQACSMGSVIAYHGHQRQASDSATRQTPNPSALGRCTGSGVRH